MTNYSLWLLFYVQAESLVKAQQDIGETMGQLGLAFVKLTKFETEEAVHDTQRARAADMKNVATAAVKASRLYRELNSQTVKHLVRVFLYYHGMKKQLLLLFLLHLQVVLLIYVTIAMLTFCKYSFLSY